MEVGGSHPGRRQVTTGYDQSTIHPRAPRGIVVLKYVRVSVEETLEFTPLQCSPDDCAMYFITNYYCVGDGQGTESSAGVFVPTRASTVWFR